MPTNLRAALDEIAKTMTASILAAIRAGTLEDLLAETRIGRGVRTTPRPAKKVVAAAEAKEVATKRAATRTKLGRLPRRSPAQVAKVLEQVVSLVKKKPGLRAEQIRVQLALDVREVPRVLKHGLDTKQLAKKGEKRSTEYFAK
jgi:hypothetical protein